MSFIFAVTIREYMKAVRSPPRWEPAKSQALRPRAVPRRERSAGVVGEAGAAVGQEPGEGWPVVLLEQVVDCFGNRVVPGHLGAFGAQPCLKVGEYRG